MRAHRRATRCDARQPALHQAAGRRADRCASRPRIARSSRSKRTSSRAAPAARSTNAWPRTAHACRHCNLGIPDRFIEHGSREDCLALAGLDPAVDRSARSRAGGTCRRAPSPPDGQRSVVSRNFSDSGAVREPPHGRLLYTAACPTIRSPTESANATPCRPSQHRFRPPSASSRTCRATPIPASIPINKVGIKDVYHPVRVKDRSRGEQHTIANFNMYVALPHNFKGTHMSRFVEVLHRNEREISVESFRDILMEMTEKLDARVRPHRNGLPVLRDEEGAGVGRREPDGLQGLADRRAARRQARAVAARSSSPQPACARARSGSRITARTTSARTSRSRRASTATCGSRS